MKHLNEKEDGMKGTIRKIVSVLLAVAMVFTSINYTPKTVKAEDYSNLGFTEVTGMNGTYAYSVTNNTIGSNVPEFYGGNYMKLAYSSDNNTDNTTVTIDGVAKSLADDEVFEFTGGMTTFYVTALSDNAYHELVVTGATGSVTIILKKGNPSGEEISSEEKTDPQETDTTELVWKTDDILTAKIGEGTKYAVEGDVLANDFNTHNGDIQKQDDQLWCIFGAAGKSIKLELNGTVLVDNTGNSAMGAAIKYSDLAAGLNTIKITQQLDEKGTISTYILYIDVPLKPINVYVNNYVSATGKYIVKFDNVDGATTYKVYVDGNATDITLGGSGDYIDYDELSGISEGEHTLALTAVLGDGTETSKSSAVTINKPATKGNADDIAQIYVQTDDTAINPLTGMTKDKVTAAITVIDQTGNTSDIYDDAAKTTIKVRGNSTAGAEKKAFNISFSKAKDVFGLGSAKKWSLLANAFDKSLIRNKIAMDFGTETMGIQYNSKSRFIDLYLNGRYMGNYLLMESVETGASRIDIDADNPASNDILLELDNNGRDVATDAHLTARTTLYNEFFAVNAPEGDGTSNPEKNQQWLETNAAKLANTLKVLNDFEEALEANDFDRISSFINVDSFVNFYIVSEFFKNQDINFSSTRFYIKDNVLYAGPMWDYDLSSGNLWTQANGGNEYSEKDRSPQDYKATEMKWFEKLMTNKTFKSKVVNRYKELLPEFKALYAEGGKIDTVINEIQGSIHRNYTSTDEGGAGWSAVQKDLGDSYSYAAGPGWTSYDNAISYLKQWIRDRETFLSSEWVSETEETTTSEKTFTHVIGTADGTLPDKSGELNNYVRYQGVSASASTVENDNNGADKAIDNDSNTKWGSVHGIDPQDIIVNLGNVYHVKELQVSWETASAKDFTVEVSKDGVNYTTVATIKDIAEGARLDKITLKDAVEAKYIKINGTARTSNYGYSIYELGIYGPDPEKEIIFEQPTIDVDAIKDWVHFDHRTNRFTSVYGTEYYISDAVLGSISTNTGQSGTYAGTYNGAADVAPWGDYSNSVIDGKATLSWVCDYGVTGVVINGQKFGIDDSNVFRKTDCIFINQDLFKLDEGVSEKIFTVTLLGTNTNKQKDFTFAMKVVNPNGETTTEEPSESTKIRPVTEPENAVWVEFPGAEGKYFYYVPSEFVSYFSTFNTRAEDLYLGCQNVAAPFQSVKVCGVNVEKAIDNGAWVGIKKTDIVEYGVYKVDFVDFNGIGFTAYIKHQKVNNYNVSGISSAVDRDGNATISWIPSEDASLAGCTYQVLVGENEAIVAGTTNASYKLSNFGTYNVKINTLLNGEIVATSTATITYKDPEAIDTTVTFKDNQWEKWRDEQIIWTKVDGAVAYAIYADGKIYQTIENADATGASVPAFAFANNTNSNGQATTVGTHTTAVVAIMQGDEVKDNLDEMNSKRIMGTNEFTLYVNYIFGNGTKIWNNTGVDSVWNFTLCESADDPNINKGSSAVITYNKDGQADVKFVDMGEHAKGDQAWTIKAAIYDEASKNGELQNLSFDIYGPSVLIGQKIAITCYPEEVQEDGQYSGVTYDKNEYTFEEDKDGNAVLHYSIAFTAENDTYDLLFGLGLLDFGDSEDKSITLSDAEIVKVYGLTSLNATGMNTETDEGNIYVAWTSDVPQRLTDAYKYNVYVDDKLVQTVDGNINNVTLEGYAVGEHKVKVESVYGTTITSTKEATATITKTTSPDLVITDISIPKGEYRVGDTVPVTVTMKNIGNADAVPEAGNLCFHLYVDGTYYGYSICTDNRLAAGAEYTATIDYVVKAHEDTSDNSYEIKAIADADNVIKNEDETNNEYARTWLFYSVLNELTLTNNGKDVVGTWEAEENAVQYRVEYISNGETKTVDTGDAVPSHIFENPIDNNTEVNVYAQNSDGSWYKIAKATALADLVFEELYLESISYVGENANIVAVVKNIGTAQATSKDAAQQIIAVTVQGVAFATLDNHPLVVNESTTLKIGYTATEAGTKTLIAQIDDIDRISESNEENNIQTLDVTSVPKGTMTLENVEDKVVSAWAPGEGMTVQSYQLEYISNGQEYTENLGTDTTFTFARPIDNETKVIVKAMYEGSTEYVPMAETVALADLIVTDVKVNGNTYVNEAFSLTSTIKNVGTAQVMAAEADDMEHYGAWVVVTLQGQLNVPEKQGDHTAAGLVVGQTREINVNDVRATAIGQYELEVKVDDPAYEQARPNGHIKESNEENNIGKVTVNVTEPAFVQEKMDWTLFTAEGINLDEEGNPFVIIANGSDRKPLEYKVLDTSIADLNYIDIMTKVQGYGGQYIAFGINNKSPMVLSTDGKVSTKLYFAQVSSHTAENYAADMDADINYGEPRSEVDGVLQNYDGNGYILHTRSFAAGKYYIVKLVNEDGTFLTLGLRIPGDLGNWIKAKASDDSDPDKVPVVYHDKYHNIDGTIYYDGSDLGLSNLSIYNGNHLAITTDGTKKLNLEGGANWKMEIAYASVDKDGKFVEKIAEDTLNHIGTNPGTIELSPEDGLFGTQGANTILIKMPELMYELPIHSSLGGERDSEYYMLKVYYDTVNHPEDYISIPMNIVGNIPMIEDVNGMTVTNRGSSLSVSWINTTSQEANGYVYDLYIDGEIKAENVTAGAYSFSGYGETGVTHEVKVVAKWCEQTIEKVINYEVKEPETEPEETIPTDIPDYPRDDKWVLISGQNILPISKEGSLDTVNAKIYYYTDVDINSVIGYNDYYIALNGSDKYFTGTTTKIYVQNGNSTTFNSKTVYDSYYNGQTLMNAAKMFSTYGEFISGETYYYTVRVAGDNGNTYKDFYFKVVPTEEEPTITGTGDWRLISGEYQLPVKMGTESELEGTVRFLDCPSTTDKYTGTNTYDIIGYNGYYMSILGSNKYFTGENTKISVSNASESVLYAENAEALEFTEKMIYDKVYPGQIIIKCAETFTVEYAKTYYLLKVESGEDVTYIPVEITVNTGEVEVLGFQMNTNHAPGEVSEHSPSFRVVSKTSNVMTIHNKLYEVKKMGTIYAFADEMDENTLKSNMTLEGVAQNDFVSNCEMTERGILDGYTTTESNSRYNTYFALTFKYLHYMFNSLETNYSFRAYAVLDDGTVVYGHNVYTTNMYEIADNLYEEQKMGTKDAHDFLYNNILNVVDISHHYEEIGKSMLSALQVKSKNEENYKLVNSTYKDLYYYAICGKNYQDAYPHDTFKCRTGEEVEAKLLVALNNVKSTEYGSIAEWIYNETPKIANSKTGVFYKGFHKLVEYGWDNTIDKDFYER